MMAKKQAAKAAANVPKLGQIPVQNMPDYIPLNFQNENMTAIGADRNAYRQSDRDFRGRHSQLLGAEGLFENSVLKDQMGDSTLAPAMQNEFLTAGLGSTLDAFGDGRTLTPGGAGEAGVAKNLGLSIAAFQDRNRQNRMQSLQLAEGLFPRREIGLSGKDATTIDLLNNQGQNAFNQANFASTVGQQQYNSRVQGLNQATAINQSNANAAAQAQQTQAIAGAVSGALNSAAGSYASSRGGASGPYGSTYESMYGGKPVYRPARA